MTKKEFTDEELEKLASLLKTHTITDAARHFGVPFYKLKYMRTKQPKLDKTIIDAVCLRRKGDLRYKTASKDNIKAEKLHKITKNTLNKSIQIEISPTEALQKFREEFEINKRKRDLEELKNLDLI